jgi:dihydroneopterin aldolase
LDLVFLRRLRLEVVVGVYEHERKAPQPILLDLEMAADVRRAAASDRLADALDYAAVADALAEYASGTDFQLVESLAEGCAELVLRRFPVEWLRLTLYKPEALERAEAAGLVIERGRRR